MLKNIKHYLKSFFLLELLKGLFVTGKYFFTKKTTVFYPEEITPRSQRFRGIHALTSLDSGKERCIGCKLCEATCPAVAITVDAYTNDEGMRIIDKYDIDLSKCMYCGLCEESCPVDAIVQTNVAEHHFEKKCEGVVNKQCLLSNGKKYKTQIKRKLAVKQINCVKKG